jgi:hypothetical protein
MSSFDWGGAEPRKIESEIMAVAIVGGGPVASTIGLYVDNPTSKLRCTVELADDQGGSIVTLNNAGSSWTARPMIITGGKGKSTPVDGAVNIFTAIPIPDTFEFVSGGRRFHFIWVLAPTAVAVAGQCNIVATVTWEPVDPQMSNAERLYWFSLCQIKRDDVTRTVRTA